MLPFERIFIDPGLALLPQHFDSPEARAMLIAIGFQESEFRARRQIAAFNPVRHGPARGFWQFEEIAVRHVMTHRSTRDFAKTVVETLALPNSIPSIYVALEQNDALACAFARLFLWPTPGALPRKDDFDYSWRYYLNTWRPGKPKPDSWANNYNTAWNMILF